jgi:hypothetical protein
MTLPTTGAPPLFPAPPCRITVEAQSGTILDID